MIIFIHGRPAPDPIGGRHLDPTPYTGAQVMEVMRMLPDIVQGETFVEWPNLFREFMGFIQESWN